jgi:plastocyanin
MNTTQNVTVNATPTVAPTPVPTAAAAPKFTITFTPAGTITNGGTVQIKAGTQVCFVNNDPYKPHGIQATSALTQAYFGSVSIPYGKPYMVTFNKTGTFSYQTLFQPSKVGTIVVTA